MQVTTQEPQAAAPQAPAPSLVSLPTLVNAYMRAGKIHGFLFAETVLARYLPVNMVEGKCNSVRAADRAPMIHALQAGPDGTAIPPAPGPARSHHSRKVHFPADGGSWARCHKPQHSIRMTTRPGLVTCKACRRSLGHSLGHSPVGALLEVAFQHAESKRS